MRHRLTGRRLGRTGEHRLAMRRNLVVSLIQHETISTTPEKAKEVKAFVERLITLAKKGTLSARRRAIALLGNHDIIDYEDGKVVRKGTIIGKLFSELGPRYLDRSGGYTRIIRLSLRRLGDNSGLVLLQFVGQDEGLKKQTKAATKRAARRKAKEAVETGEAAEAEEVVEAQEPDKDEEAAETEDTTEARSRQNESNKQQ